jgi:hypothetical protein
MADIIIRGPFFDGRDRAVVSLMCSDIARTVAERGTDLVQQELPRVLKHPTGRFQSGVHTEAGGNTAKTTDDGIIYGHWLEGTGSRNKTTRFKGYFTFRRMGVLLDAMAGSIANQVAKRYIGRM